MDARVGEEKTVTETGCRIDVGWNSRADISLLYEAESGWAVESVEVIEVSKRQRVNYTLNKTAANTDFISEAKLNALFEEVGKYVRENGKEEKYREEIETKRREFIETYNRFRASQSRVTVTGSVRGDNDFLKRQPGRAYLDLKVKLVRFLAPDEVDKIKDELKRRVSDAQPLS